LEHKPLAAWKQAAIEAMKLPSIPALRGLNLIALGAGISTFSNKVRLECAGFRTVRQVSAKPYFFLANLTRWQYAKPLNCLCE